MTVQVIYLRPKKKTYSAYMGKLAEYGYIINPNLSTKTWDDAYYAMTHCCFKVVPRSHMDVADYERAFGKPFGNEDKGEFVYSTVGPISNSVLSSSVKLGSPVNFDDIKNDILFTVRTFFDNMFHQNELLTEKRIDNLKKPDYNLKICYDAVERYENSFRRERARAKREEVLARRREAEEKAAAIQKQKEEDENIAKWIEEFEDFPDLLNDLYQYRGMSPDERMKSSLRVSIPNRVRELNLIHQNSKIDEDYLISSGNCIDYCKHLSDSLSPGDLMEYGAFRYIVENPCFGSHVRFIANAVIPKRNFGFTEVDGIAISEYGIFVIESKNYSYTVYADDKEKKWKYDYVNRPEFDSPLLQNLHHANILKEYLYDHPIEGIKVEDTPFTLLVVFPSNIEVKREKSRIRLDENMQYYIGSVDMKNNGYYASENTSSTVETRLTNQFTPMNMPELTIEQIDALHDFMEKAFIRDKNERDQLFQEREWDTIPVPKKYKYFVTPNNNILRSDNYSVDKITTISYKIWCSFGTEKLAKQLFARDKYSQANGIKGPFRDFEYAYGVSRNMGGY